MKLSNKVQSRKGKGQSIKKLLSPSLFVLRPVGFTLIELLVSIVITGMMLTLVMASYWTFLQTNAKMAVSREIQSEVRFTLTRLADKVRASTINYAEYELGGLCNVNLNRNLCLLTPGGDTYLFRYDNAAQTLSLGSDDATLQPLLSPNRYQVTSLYFGYAPQNDPTDLSQAQQQPKVTIFLSVSPSDERYQDLSIETQTTISSRQY